MSQELAAQIHGHALEFLQAGISKGEMEEELGKIRQHLKTDFTAVNWEESGLREMWSRLMKLLQEAERQLDMIDGERQKE
jgi:hypothetical protein